MGYNLSPLRGCCFRAYVENPMLDSPGGPPGRAVRAGTKVSSPRRQPWELDMCNLDVHVGCKSRILNFDGTIILLFARYVFWNSTPTPLYFERYTINRVKSQT